MKTSTNAVDKKEKSTREKTRIVVSWSLVSTLFEKSYQYIYMQSQDALRVSTAIVFLRLSTPIGDPSTPIVQ
eukprot:COSAG02_NODE_2024_length_10084_cov_130.539509_4_plen_72_part_00